MGTVTKADLVLDVYERHGGLSKKWRAYVVNLVFDIIKEKLLDKEDVQLWGFGTFRVKHKHARRVLIPKSGEEAIVSERFIVSFQPGKNLLERFFRNGNLIVELK